MHRKAGTRKSRGASTIVLMIVLAVFVILPLGLLGFEMARSFLIQQELRNITDSAALSGTAAMASAPETDINGNPTTYQQRQIIAMNTALQTFQFNSILQTPFGVSNVTGIQNPQPPTPQTPSVHSAILNILLLDQTGAQVATGVPAATLTVQAYYTDSPIFVSSIMPIQQTFTLQATSNGGLPLLDVILCMDVSGSMDDQTPINFINRYWDVGTLKMVYQTPTSSTGKIGRGVMYDVLLPVSTGTSLNVYPPQNLENATYQLAGISNTNGFTWSETPATAGPPAVTWSTQKGLRSNTVGYPAGPANMPEQGMPPGNYNPSARGTQRTNPNTGLPYNPLAAQGSGGFTDMVVLMPSYPTTVSYNGTNYIFSNVETEVEAQRGNMESLAALKSACGNTVPAAITQTPAAGYYGAYMTYVLNNAQPIATAREAAYNFFNTMNISSNAHFGLVCFSTTPGTSSTSVFSDTNENLSTSYTTGGTGTFPNPLIKLSLTDPNTLQFANVSQAIQGNPVNSPLKWSATINPLRAEGSTDIAESLQEALDELAIPGSALVRPTAKRAVVLFTDGISNRPLPSSGSDGLALAQGTRAQPMGIPIYTIGLSTNAALQTQQANLLGDSAGAPGIAFKSQNGAIFIAATAAAQLDQAFQTIARSLCAIH